MGKLEKLSEGRMKELQAVAAMLTGTNDQERHYMLTHLFVTPKEPRGPWCQTFTGEKFHFLTPEREDFKPANIAQGLAHECRFAGQCSDFYSVAQHCALGAEHIRVGYELEFLLHDTTEHIMKDIPTPLKAMLPFYQAIEWGVERAMRHSFALPEEMSETVKKMDADMLATEHLRFLKQEGPGLWKANGQVLNFKIEPWGNETARSRWQFMFYRHARGAGLCFPSDW